MLKGKTVVLGVTGGIAAYKACEIASALTKLHADVRVVMTEHAKEFITPLTFEALTRNRVASDMFGRDFTWDDAHVSLAKAADIFIIAPATANVIGKLANGIADDLLTTTAMACKAPRLICPAMNCMMYEDAAFLNNLDTLKQRGARILEPDYGPLACGDVGKGRLAEPEAIVAECVRILLPRRDFAGKRVLVTAGPTAEDIDGVRFISNYSSGKMGVEIAKAAKHRGAFVTLIAGRISAEAPDCIDETVSVVSTMDMYNAVLARADKNDYFIMAAAPADYRPEKRADNKIKTEKLSLELIKNPDIAKAVGEKKGKSKLIVFAAETEDLIKNAEAKLLAKHADMAVANDLKMEGAGFNGDTNIITVLKAGGIKKAYPKMTKTEAADVILDEAIIL